MVTPEYQDVGWDRVARAVEAVRGCMDRTVSTLEAADVPYAVVGGNAVAAWVSRIDEAAVRNTRNVDILLCRAGFDAARAAMIRAGFVPRHTAGLDMFFESPDAKDRDRVRVVFAGERVRAGDLTAAPEMSDVELINGRHVVALEALLRMKLTAHRTIDRVHVRDMIEVGLVDATWPARFQPELAARLQELLDDPDG